MGVVRTDYLMYGVKIGHDRVDYDKHEAMMEGRPDAPFSLIVDGMSGKYAVAGRVIASADGYDGEMFEEIDPAALIDDGSLKARIEDALGPVDNLRLLFFAHYS